MIWSMASAVERLLWACIILDSGVRSISLPEISDLKFIEECVKEHNLARSSVSPPATDMLYMTWDEALAITAKAWAKRCIFDHNIYLKDASRVHPTFPSVGENIWTAHPPSQFNTSKAIKRWVDEVKDYSYQENSCNKVCGHYTQVVWASTYKVGCAVQLCPDGINSVHLTLGPAATSGLCSSCLTFPSSTCWSLWKLRHSHHQTTELFLHTGQHLDNPPPFTVYTVTKKPPKNHRPIKTKNHHRPTRPGGPMASPAMVSP
uniref:GLI pathogenesis related 1 n=1 Tax=Haplochromis burtoni TaxID=8153 RepID=A0A3Q2VHX7_HAPBU